MDSQLPSLREPYVPLPGAALGVYEVGSRGSGMRCGDEHTSVEARARGPEISPPPAPASLGTEDTELVGPFGD